MLVSSLRVSVRVHGCSATTATFAWTDHKGLVDTLLLPVPPTAAVPECGPSHFLFFGLFSQTALQAPASLDSAAIVLGADT